MIDGVVVTPLKQIPDERGAIMHMLRSDAPHFQQFGEIYFSWVFPGAIKAWHLHREMVLNYAVPTGRIKLVLYDDRAESPTKGQLMEIFVGEGKYDLITIPALVWNGFKGVGTKPAMVANCTTIP
ncbi:MAG: dTDP-4-dehydrorhamnose 3,5-epimerase family protein, partial [Gemmatimonadaceae bacterium]|nr:dTDP-4-dehydrorhamnose 3,5-epimerase family protein [Gemmatimonadaceae bacterium]